MIKRLVIGPLQENCYIVSCGHTCVIIDPGDEANHIIQEIENDHLEVKGILVTHGHFDHIGAVNELKAYYHTDVYATKDTKDMMLNWDENLSVMIGGEKYIVEDVQIIDDTIMLEGMNFKVYETPGHAKGSCLYYYEQENALFTGDTLFRGGCGRIDFPTGNQSAMIQSLSKIKQFIFDADVYPGHGPQSKISLEKRNNPYLSF
nr:MBL fold metallo-hydrolase [Catenibacterium mitsuokai]